MKIYKQSNIPKRSHNYSPITNYDDLKQPKGAQSTIFSSQEAQRNFSYTAEVPKDAKGSARIE